MKWLGVLFVLVASGWIGFHKVFVLKQEIHLLEQLGQLIRFLQRELEQRGTPLPEILCRAADQGLMENELLEYLAEKLRAGETVSCAAEPFLTSVSNAIEQPLRTLCGVLGRYDSATQSKACTQALLQLETRRESLAEELTAKGRLYGTVPVAFGFITVLILF